MKTIIIAEAGVNHNGDRIWQKNSLMRPKKQVPILLNFRLPLTALPNMLQRQNIRNAKPEQMKPSWRWQKNSV